MNQDEYKSLFVKLGVAVLSAVAGALHQNFGVASYTAISTDIVDLGFLAYGVYMHWGMKKVPENSIVVTGPKGR